MLSSSSSKFNQHSCTDTGRYGGARYFSRKVWSVFLWQFISRTRRQLHTSSADNGSIPATSAISTQLRGLRWPPVGEGGMKDDKELCVCVCVMGRTYGFACMHECVPVCLPRPLADTAGFRSRVNVHGTPPSFGSKDWFCHVTSV